MKYIFMALLTSYSPLPTATLPPIVCMVVYPTPDHKTLVCSLAIAGRQLYKT